MSYSKEDLKSLVRILKGKNMYLLYDFSRLRGWRVVKMGDSDGVIREGIFIPFFNNGISMDDKYTRITQLLGVELHKVRPYLGFINFVPMIGVEAHEVMLQEGSIAPRQRWAEACVGLRLVWGCNQKKR